jgi:hypothetical protein
MSTEELIIALARILGSLPVLRWPFAGGVLALVVDLSDLFMMNLLELGGVSNYQAFDKRLDQVYMACFLVVALRWPDPARAVAVLLYGLRMVGFVAFELSGAREVLVLFPNLFEFWFLFVAYVEPMRVGEPVPAGAGSAIAVGPEGGQVVGRRTVFGRQILFDRRSVLVLLGVLLSLKMAQEIAIHWLKLLDSLGEVAILGADDSGRRSSQVDSTKSVVRIAAEATHHRQMASSTNNST